jgi:hypothetical protein
MNNDHPTPYGDLNEKRADEIEAHIQKLSEEEQVQQDIDAMVEVVEKNLPTEEEIAAETARQIIIDERTDAFVQIFDYAEENDIHFDSPTWRAVSLQATKESGIRTTHTTEDLSDLKVEPELMSYYEFNRIIRKARTAIKLAVEQRKKFVKIMKHGEPTGEVAGPYFQNRKTKRGLLRHVLGRKRATSRSCRASEILLDNKKRKGILKPLEQQQV